MLLRRPAGNHLCATNSANVRTMLAIAKRNTVNVPSSGASHGVYRSAMRNISGPSTTRTPRASEPNAATSTYPIDSSRSRIQVSRLQFAIGAVEADAQALDSAGGEIDREHGADRERAGVGVGQHVVNFPRDRQ